MTEQDTPVRVRWARLRFAIISQLLQSPPEAGQLSVEIAALAARAWRHPTSGNVIRFSAKSIERWYYLARDDPNPIVVLERKLPSHTGTQRSVTPATADMLRQLRRDHPKWSHQLIYDNLVVIARQQPELGALPSYSTVCRFMKQNGLGRQRKPKRHELQPGFVPRERRSYEVKHVHGLWHCDFHEGSRKVLTPSGDRHAVVLFALLDDHSRLCCHAQWYAIARENTESFVHGICQALQKRGLPRALLSDNGSPMEAAETTEGLGRLSIIHHTTLSQSPEQNGKQEVFWAQVEGRYLAMLDGEPELTLDLLNVSMQAWVEREYNRSLHDGIKQTPLERWLAGPSVGRPCPSSDELRRAFRMEVCRTQRRSDGTLTVHGVRYEIPAVYRSLTRLTVRVARWDLSSVDLVDPRRGTHLATLYPVDKERNADGRRRALPQPDMAPSPSSPSRPPPGMAPLLKQLMAEYAATGLPPAYITHDASEQDEDIEEDSP
jgi:putative transposase